MKHAGFIIPPPRALCSIRRQGSKCHRRHIFRRGTPRPARPRMRSRLIANEKVSMRIEELKEKISEGVVQFAVRERSARLQILQASVDGMLQVIAGARLRARRPPRRRQRAAGQGLSRQKRRKGDLEVRRGPDGAAPRHAEAGGDRRRAVDGETGSHRLDLDCHGKCLADCRTRPARRRRRRRRSRGARSGVDPSSRRCAQ